MATKKQKKELETALGEWVFDGIASEWSTTEILVQVAKDWRKVVGAGRATSTTGADLKGLAEWQGTVMNLLGVGTGAEAAKKQRVRSANIVLTAFSGAGPDSIMAEFGKTVAMDVMADTFTGREQLLRQTFSSGSLQ